MQWTEKGKLNIKAADLVLLSTPTFRGKPWANVSSWVRTENNYPPIPSAVFRTSVCSKENKSQDALGAILSSA